MVPHVIQPIKEVIHGRFPRHAVLLSSVSDCLSETVCFSYQFEHLDKPIAIFQIGK